MRKIFGSAMIFSAIGAVIIGGATAWNADLTVDLTDSTVGVASVALDTTFGPNANGLDETGEVLGPDDGLFTLVAGIGLDNTGDFNLIWDPASQLQITNVSGANQGQASCGILNFATLLKPVNTWTGKVPPYDADGGLDAQAFIAVHPGAPNACQGATVSSTATIRVLTAPKS
jgi:hypothetical protein